MPVFERLIAAIDAEGAAALVTVAAVEGSSPREAGARMVVRPSGGFHGTIGGGTLEWQALGEARKALAAGRGPAGQMTMSLGPDLGQCCGGRVTLLIETFDVRDRAGISALVDAERAGALSTEARIDPEGRLERHLVAVSNAGERIVRLAGGVFLERFDPKGTPLLLFGAGHVGRALVLALAPLPFAVRWINSREAAFPQAVPGNVSLVCSERPAAELDGAPADAFVLIMTHSHPLDFDITLRALGGGRFAHVGLIGSATKRARFLSRLRSAGVSERDLARLVCPIGLASIRGKEPPIIAASVAADLLVRRQALADAWADKPLRQAGAR